MALSLGRRNKAGAAPQGCGILFGLGWTAFSLIFVGFGLWTFWGSVRSQTWMEVPCELVSFEIVDHPDQDPPFRPDVRFTYRHEGRWYEGDRLTTDDNEGEDDYLDLVGTRQELMENHELTCRVNPGNPAEAVLIGAARDAWFGLVFAAFGGFFALAGVGMMVASVRSGKAAKAKSGTPQPEKAMGGILAFGFFGVFAAAGLGILFGFVVPKAVEYFDMKGWVETPGEVVWSRVRSHSSDDGTTYSVDIFYRYEFGGVEYRSNRESIMGGSSSGRSRKAEIVANHPPGTPLTCYVDPDEPWMAVRQRKIGWWALFALFPLPFAAVGLGGLWFTFFKRKGGKRGAESRTAGRPTPEVPAAPSPELPKLTGSGASVGKRLLHVLFALLLAGFWNGITSLFGWHVWEGWSKGEAPWFLTLFLTPFVLIGLGMIGHVFYRIAAIFSPIYQLEFSDRYLSPGGHASISWRRTGGGGQPRRLSLWLVGREEATYRRGTDTATAKSIFHEEALFETETRMMMPAGRVTVDLAPDAVPSFRAAHNKVLWFVILVADVPGRPDVREEYEIDVREGGGR